MFVSSLGDNDLSLNGQLVITWNNADLMSIGPPGTNFSKISTNIQGVSVKMMHFKTLCVKCCPLRLSLSEWVKVPELDQH